MKCADRTLTISKRELDVFAYMLGAFPAPQHRARVVVDHVCGRVLVETDFAVLLLDSTEEVLPELNPPQQYSVMSVGKNELREKIRKIKVSESIRFFEESGALKCDRFEVQPAPSSVPVCVAALEVSEGEAMPPLSATMLAGETYQVLAKIVAVTKAPSVTMATGPAHVKGAPVLRFAVRAKGAIWRLYVLACT